MSDVRDICKPTQFMLETRLFHPFLYFFSLKESAEITPLPSSAYFLKNVYRLDTVHWYKNKVFWFTLKLDYVSNKYSLKYNNVF